MSVAVGMAFKDDMKQGTGSFVIFSLYVLYEITSLACYSHGK